MRLTDKQYEILCALADGQEVTAIAHKLGITDNSVRRRMRNLFATLGAKNAAHAVSVAYRSRLLPVWGERYGIQPKDKISTSLS